MNTFWTFGNDQPFDLTGAQSPKLPNFEKTSDKKFYIHKVSKNQIVQGV